MEPVRWGVLSTAAIGVDHVIPAMQKEESCDIRALASRDAAKADKVAAALGIPCAYGSYEELIADPHIEAIYNPLPNHLHVPWSIKAAEAGKHVLCEKPIALNAAEARTLVEARDRTRVLIQEAIMTRTHPQWLRIRELVREGRIGRVRTVWGTLNYHLTDPNNVRNQADIGGGGIYDIGYYPITTARFVFETEPIRVVSLVEYDPVFGVDRLACALLDFPNGQASFICGTQLIPFQRFVIIGSAGSIETPTGFGAPVDRPVKILINGGAGDLIHGGNDQTEEPIEPIDQYGRQGALFSRAIRGEGTQQVPLEDAVANMKVIDALYRSARSGRWEAV